MKHFLNNIRCEESEIARIISDCKQNCTYLKAPNGHPSNLTPEEWVLVRSQAFIKRFGNWENWIKKDFLVNGNAVAKLTGKEFSIIKGKTLLDQVEDYFKSIGNKAVSPIFGDVILDRRGADDSLAHGMGRKKAIAYAAVKDVIENGIIIDTSINHKGRGYNTVVIAAPIHIEEERYICEVIVRRNANEDRFYLHEVTSIKKLQDAVFVTSLGQNPSAHLGVAAKILQEILCASILPQNFFDENGEPKLD